MVKGLAFRTLIATYEELHGSNAVEAVFSRLWHADAETIRLRVVAGSWYPAGLYRGLWNAIADGSGRRDELAQHLGRECMRRDMTGPYRLAFKLLAPENALDAAGRVFNSYFDTGRLVVVESREGFARATFSGCRGFHRLMWMKVLGSAEMALELAGAQKLKLRYVRGAMDADLESELVGHWT